jgi:hypothetical protein
LALKESATRQFPVKPEDLFLCVIDHFCNILLLVSKQMLCWARFQRTIPHLTCAVRPRQVTYERFFGTTQPTQFFQTVEDELEENSNRKPLSPKEKKELLDSIIRVVSSLELTEHGRKFS